ncbi:NUDIX hydrolase [Ornithinibacillus salinisoli]|uniref:NUDIX hydrolase n=1 Tax=Ornithinibacillus salinisoli TaxID=1848459 RepID=A0ABW4W4T6_9BACI
METITFGEKEEGKEFIWRQAVYGLMFNSQKDRLAIIQTSDGEYFLPGGGIENNETHEECLKRESVEEMGMYIKVGSFIGCARRYFYSSNENKHYLSQGYFYLCEMGRQVSKPIEDDHFLQWIEPSQSTEILFHEHQIWAVKEALRKSKLIR